MADPAPPAPPPTGAPIDDPLHLLGPQVQALVVMGVSGCGKTSLGSALAQALHWEFADADTFHPLANVEKMRAGIALNDDDRWPWLARLNTIMRESLARQRPIVLACSALKEKYREMLAADIDGLVFVHMQGSFELIDARIQARQHKYMPTSLLRSQFDSLEPPTRAVRADIVWPVPALVQALLAAGLPAQAPIDAPPGQSNE